VSSSEQEPHRRNRLLATLRPQDHALLAPHLQVVLIGEGEILHLPGDKIEQVYFLHSGIVALMAVAEDGGAISTASIGREGAIGTIAGSGIVRAFTRALVQVPGAASRMPVARFRDALRKSEAISELMTRYHMAMMAQVQQTSLCNSLHDGLARLSRLLLLLDEQSGKEDISLTQDRLAGMLGLRRTSVTAAAQALQTKGLIRYRRGRIEILDHKKLKAAACECYDVMRRTFDQLVEGKR
jgi:CRP-like cAMP-binding protein